MSRRRPPDRAAEIKPAATILLLRDEPTFEVLMVKRHHQIDFASGALVFPGGKTHAGDHDPDLGRATWSAGTHFDADQRALRIAAIREVFEEAGILLARRRDGAADGRRGLPDGRAPGGGRRRRRAFIDVVRDLDAGSTWTR